MIPAEWIEDLRLISAYHIDVFVPGISEGLLPESFVKLRAKGYSMEGKDGGILIRAPYERRDDLLDDVLNDLRGVLNRIERLVK